MLCGSVRRKEKRGKRLCSEGADFRVPQKEQPALFTKPLFPRGPDACQVDCSPAFQVSVSLLLLVVEALTFLILTWTGRWRTGDLQSHFSWKLGGIDTTVNKSYQYKITVPFRYALCTAEAPSPGRTHTLSLACINFEHQFWTVKVHNVGRRYYVVY